MSVIENITEACEGLGQVDLNGISLESADPALLKVTEEGLDQHVSMQPGAIAYYGSLLKDAQRRHASLKRAYDRWEKKQFALAKASLMSGGGKGTVQDIEARFVVDNEADIEKWEENLDKHQLEMDTLHVWYEAWRQKSFSIREFASITEDERWNSSGSVGRNGNGDHSGTPQENSLSPSRIARVRSIIKKRKHSQTTA